MSVSTTAGLRSERTLRITSTTAFIVPGDVNTLDVLLVGGGGGGGQYEVNGSSGGGGGGGQYIEQTLTVVPNTSYTITIGAGGTSGINVGYGRGTDTTLGTLMTALGGGGGAGGSGAVSYCSSTGGLIFYGGGGATFTPKTNGIPTYADPQYTSSGFPGANDSNQLMGGMGINGYSGGGAAGIWNNPNRTAASRHGGGLGSTYTLPATPGVANTGGGGGAGTRFDASIKFAGANGGSGIAIIKYWSAF